MTCLEVCAQVDACCCVVCHEGSTFIIACEYGIIKRIPTTMSKKTKPLANPMTYDTFGWMGWVAQVALIAIHRRLPKGTHPAQST